MVFARTPGVFSRSSDHPSDCQDDEEEKERRLHAGVTPPMFDAASGRSAQTDESAFQFLAVAQHQKLICIKQ